MTAHLLTEVCHQVQVEPELQPVSNPDSFSLSTANTQEGARLDFVMNGFWGSRSCEFSIPMPAPSNMHFISAAESAAYRRHEQDY